jgi:GNAT superfamily N-acetyltransferase
MNPSPARPPGIIHRWTLEMNGLDELKPKSVEREDIVIRRVEVALPAFNRFLHEAVGREFRWDGRDDWSEAHWAAYVDRLELETWVLYVKGTPAGYFETEHGADNSARIHNFGLLRPFFGQGLGGHLLTFAIRRAFLRGAQRLWVRTCTKDHAHALRNYRARGFRIVQEEDLPGKATRE